MTRILSVDGGGTKINAILFDENANLLGRGTSGGINLTQTPADIARQHMRECLQQVFAQEKPDEIDLLYGVIIGDGAAFVEELEKLTRVKEYAFHDEAEAGLLAGSLKKSGLLALSGTGSDVFYFSDAQYKVVGGWGSYIGDDGSGTWIGQQAVRAIVRYINGWGAPTCMYDMLVKEWKLERDWQIVEIIQGAPAPFGKMASLTRLVGRAAAQGDQVALDILNEAGRVLACQMCSLLERIEGEPESMDITLCGGAWKTHPAMLESFVNNMQKVYPQATAHRSLFEHVCAGAVEYLLNQGYSEEKVFDIMNKQFSGYRIEGGTK